MILLELELLVGFYECWLGLELFCLRSAARTHLLVLVGFYCLLWSLLVLAYVVTA